MDRPAEASDHEHLQRQQAKLLLLCRRALATPVARGMLTLGSLPPGPLLAEPLPVPGICLAGRRKDGRLCLTMMMVIMGCGTCE